MKRMIIGFCTLFVNEEESKAAQKSSCTYCYNSHAGDDAQEASITENEATLPTVAGPATLPEPDVSPINSPLQQFYG